jgi:hypothetical protein
VKTTAAIVVAVALTGCAHRAPPVADTPREVPVFEGAARARAACPNYDHVMRESSFPRDAIVRGIESGSATVRFEVVDGHVRVVSVISSDPAFGTTALELARRFECRTDGPTTFEIPLTWQTSRSGSTPR